MIASGAQRYVSKTYYIMQAGSYWMAYRVKKVDISSQIWISHEFNEMMNTRPMSYIVYTIFMWFGRYSHFQTILEQVDLQFIEQFKLEFIGKKV